MECNNARPLIQSYLDGELTEAQAAPLRKHLLACQACRASAQSDKNLKRWFAEPAAVAVPRDFAARVARRAFAGDRGERFTDVAVAPALPLRARQMQPTRGSDESTLRFVLTLTALAAGLLVVLSIAIKSSTLPSGNRMLADDHRTLSVHDAIERLDQLNQAQLNQGPNHPVLDASKSTPAKKSAEGAKPESPR